MNLQPDTILKKVFGYDSFRPLQREIIANVLNKRDTLAIMPTGGGKSLCYQIPSLIFPGLTVVVSPLISLMKDQVGQLAELGVPALFLNSSLTLEEYQQNVMRVRSRAVKLLYVAPETLVMSRIQALLSSLQVDCLTIDEAHCISEWGHDFRPEYRQLIPVRQQFPEAVCLALTATATPRVRSDIQASLGFENSDDFVASFNRPNLLIEVVPKEDPYRQTLEVIDRNRDGSGIIYCFSRKQVDELAGRLRMRGLSVRPYHAGLSDEERRENQDLFSRDDVQIIVATIAFGMGINKPNVRFVVHYDLPKSIESYYQEIGRAGRDGLQAECVLLFGYGDLAKQRYFIDQKDGAERQSAIDHLTALIRYAESYVCRRKPLLAYFGEQFSAENCGMCDQCLEGEKRLVDVTIPAQKFLSCVKRTGERFGIGHIVDILLGKGTAKVMKFGHQDLTTFGIGKELTLQQWQGLARQLVQKEYLTQEGAPYPVLKLTAKAYALFRGEEAAMGVIEEPQGKPRKAAKPDAVMGPDYDAALFELLRARRKNLADEAHIPPYMIFSDRTLMEMAAYRPIHPEHLRSIFGVGERKNERYGQAFLSIIAAYCQERGLPTREAPQTPTRVEKKPRHVEVGEAYNDGATISSLAEQFGVQYGTVLDNLGKYLQGGNTLRAGEDLLDLPALPVGTQQRILEAFDRLGAEYLKPVFENLGGEVEYDALKAMRLYYLAKKSG